MANGRGTGLGVDRTGGPVIDPTKNVENAIESLKEHVADLRTADEKLASERKENAEFVARLRAEHAKEIRLVDVAAAALNQKTNLDAIQALAQTTESIRSALSKQVTDSADALARQKSESDKQTDQRITALEKTSYTGAGEKAVSDPAMVLLAQSVAELVKITQGTGGERRGSERMWAALSIAISVLIALGSLTFAVLHAVP